MSLISSQKILKLQWLQSTKRSKSLAALASLSPTKLSELMKAFLKAQASLLSFQSHLAIRSVPRRVDIVEVDRGRRAQAGVLQGCPLSAGDPVRPKGAGFLPFVRFDTAAVPPQIKGGDHIYLIFTYSEAAIEGKEDGTVAADDKELKSSCIFRVWRKDGTNAVCQDGDDVFFEHVDTGKYLEGATDTQPLALADKDENASGQVWGFFKQGRPMEMRHRDTVYLQTWLHNYVEYRRESLATLVLGGQRVSEAFSSLKVLRG